MFNNQINLLSLFGGFMLCLSASIVGLAILLLDEMTYGYTNYQDVSNEDWLFFYAFCAFGIAWSASSIALLFKVDRARHAFSIYYILLILLWTILVALSFNDFNGRIHTPFIGLSIAIYGSLLFCLLFINNQAVIVQIKGKGTFYEEREDILDT